MPFEVSGYNEESSSKTSISPLEDHPHLSEQYSSFLKSQCLCSSSTGIGEVLKSQLNRDVKDLDNKLVLSESESISLQCIDFEKSILDCCDRLFSATSPARIVETLHHTFTVIYTHSKVGTTQLKESRLLIGKKFMQVLER